MNENKKNIELAILVILIFIGVWAIPNGLLAAIRATGSVVFGLWFPGWIWSYSLFKGTLEFLERQVLSIAFSVTALPLLLFAVNAAGFPITLLSSVLTVVFTSVLGLLSLLLRLEKRHAA